MKPYYQGNLEQIINGDCRDMSELSDESVQCVVTSPPYWGLRKYAGLQDLIWGDNHCEHEWVEGITGLNSENRQGLSTGVVGGHKELHGKGLTPIATCSLCGAWKGQYGLEPTPEMYIEHTIEILREIRRVLRKDGVVFWNIGDSYFGGGFGTSPGGNEDFARRYPKQASNKGSADHDDRKLLGSLKKSHSTLKPKDLCLIPFRLAIAAQSNGWWVRSVIIWSKPNPMPESVTDRPTESHEYILMLTKSGTSQYWTHRDSGGTRTRPKPDYRWINQISQEEVAIEPPNWKVKIKCPKCLGVGTIGVYLGLDVWQTAKCPICNSKKETQLWKRINLWRGHDYYWDADAVRTKFADATLSRVLYPTGMTGKVAYQVKHKVGGGPPQRENFKHLLETGGANIKSVWEFPTKSYHDAHFAVFPEKLPETCIKAATPEVGCCSKCGAPWERVTESQKGFTNGKCNMCGESESKHIVSAKSSMVNFGSDKRTNTAIPCSVNKTIGWQPTCKCNADKVPSLVLDPFMGSGTVLWVAKKLGRRAVGYELSEEYCQLALERNRQMAMELKA